MKKLFLLFVAAATLNSANAQQEVQLLQSAEISFEKTQHDFGTVTQNEPTVFDFKLTNTGNTPLIISEVKRVCGCTTPKWPKEPIQPGESEVIQVKYDSRRVGPFNKEIKVISNANTAHVPLRIKGTIVVPANTTPVKSGSSGIPYEKN